MSLHADALAVLRAWQPPADAHAARQEELRERYVAHLEATPDGMWRSSYPDHLTAGAPVASTTSAPVVPLRRARRGR